MRYTASLAYAYGEDSSNLGAQKAIAGHRLLGGELRIEHVEDRLKACIHEDLNLSLVGQMLSRRTEISSTDDRFFKRSDDAWSNACCRVGRMSRIRRS